MFTHDILLAISTAMYTVQPLFTEQDFIMLPGMAPIIIQDPGHGDSTSVILHTLDGDSAGDTVPHGLVLVSVMDTDTDITVMVTGVVAGGDLPFIIRPFGADGMEAQGPQDSMEIISTYIMVCM